MLTFNNNKVFAYKSRGLIVYKYGIAILPGLTFFRRLTVNTTASSNSEVSSKIVQYWANSIKSSRILSREIIEELLVFSTENCLAGENPINTSVTGVAYRNAFISEGTITILLFSNNKDRTNHELAFVSNKCARNEFVWIYNEVQIIVDDSVSKTDFLRVIESKTEGFKFDLINNYKKFHKSFSFFDIYYTTLASLNNLDSISHFGMLIPNPFKSHVSFVAYPTCLLGSKLKSDIEYGIGISKPSQSNEFFDETFGIKFDGSITKDQIYMIMDNYSQEFSSEFLTLLKLFKRFETNRIKNAVLVSDWNIYVLAKQLFARFSACSEIVRFAWENIALEGNTPTKSSLEIANKVGYCIPVLYFDKSLNVMLENEVKFSKEFVMDSNGNLGLKVLKRPSKKLLPGKNFYSNKFTKRSFSSAFTELFSFMDRLASLGAKKLPSVEASNIVNSVIANCKSSIKTLTVYHTHGGMFKMRPSIFTQTHGIFPKNPENLVSGYSGKGLNVPNTENLIENSSKILQAKNFSWVSTSESTIASRLALPLPGNINEVLSDLPTPLRLKIEELEKSADEAGKCISLTAREGSTRLDVQIHEVPRIVVMQKDGQELASMSSELERVATEDISARKSKSTEQIPYRQFSNDIVNDSRKLLSEMKSIKVSSPSYEASVNEQAESLYRTILKSVKK